MTRHLQHWLRALGNDDVRVRQQAGRALANVLSELVGSMPRVREALRDDDIVVRLEVCGILIAAGSLSCEVEPALPELMKCVSVGPTGEAAVVLGQMGAKAARAVTLLIDALKDPNPEDRRLVAEALGNLGPDARAAIPFLASLLSDEVEEVRLAAASSLAKLEDSPKPALDFLVGYLDHEDANLRSCAIAVLGSLGEKAKNAIPELLGALRDGDWMVRAEAAQALGTIGPSAVEAVPYLDQMLCDPHEFVQRAARCAMGKITADDESGAATRKSEGGSIPQDG